MLDEHMLVDLLVLPVFLEETPKNPHSSHPDDFLRHTSISCTLPLTGSCIARVIKYSTFKFKVGLKLISVFLAFDFVPVIWRP